MPNQYYILYQNFTTMQKQIILFFVILFCSTQIVFSQKSSTDSQLAYQYYQDKEYEKAATLYEKLYEKSRSRIYFRYYLKCLTELKDFRTAERVVKRQIRRNKDNMAYYVELGYLYKLQKEKNKSQKTYEEAIENVRNDKFAIIQLANAFLSKHEYNYAENVYLKGQKTIPDYQFYLELANVYAYTRNFEKMIDQYLNVLAKNPENMETVQGRLQYYVVNDKDNTIREILRKQLLKRIQSRNNRIVHTAYGELIIWLFIQEKKFKPAFFQVKALDKRNNEDGNRVLNLAKIALKNHAYDVALDACQYVIDKGRDGKYYLTARLAILDVYYQKVLSNEITTKEQIAELEKSYLKAIDEFGRTEQTVKIIKDLAHLQAFYLDKPQQAIALLESVLELTRIQPVTLAECKLELGDILLLTGEIWDATIIYAQVEKKHKNSPIGHEAKFKKAKLAFFTGDFQWAQAQLDILKASTSKLIANDACDLSLLIRDNTALDTTETALQQYANAQLLMLQNKDSLAILTLDSIMNLYKNHTLGDEVLMKKAEIAQKRGNYTKAIGYLEKLVAAYPADILADDALFKMAEIYEFHIRDNEKAMEKYKEIITKYQASIHLVEARKRFRRLRGN